MKSYVYFLGLTLSLLSTLFFVGCDIQSGDDVVRNVEDDYTGFYRRTDGGNFIEPGNTGPSINALNIRQNGDVLEATDNNGYIYRGNIGSSSSGNASFNMSGISAAGIEVTFSGTITKEGTSGTLQGSYIEPELFGTVFGTATVPAAPEEEPEEEEENNNNTPGNTTTNGTFSN